MSYSHAGDDLLAPQLQAGLQRFAKPWWKRRAMRVFRDDASLSANPHLWSSIAQALDSSEWFVLLLSEEAAASDWVDREVAYWLEHKAASHILPVVTDGDFIWAGGDIAAESTSVPPALHGAFEEEPRWVDLRWARRETHLQLRNPRFRDGVADVASAIRGIPKDELESEEIRQHRRTRRTAWTAGIALFLLAIAATLSAVIAIDRSSEARDQRDEAERQAAIALQNEQTAQENARLAEEQARIAEENQRLADEQRVIAEQQSRLSYARALAANAMAAVSLDDDRALLLAMAAANATTSAGEPILPEALDALHQALGGHRILARFQGGGGPDIAWSEDGARLLTTPPGLSSNEATIWVAATTEPLAVLRGDSPVTGAAWSADGRLVATTHRSGRVNLWQGGAAPPVAFLDNNRLVDTPVFDRRGRLLAVDEAGPLVRVWDVTTQVPLWEIDAGSSGRMSFNADGSLLAIQVAWPAPIEAGVWDMETGEMVWSLPSPPDAVRGRPVDIAFNPAGSSLAVLYPDPAMVTVWDIDSGTQLLSFEPLGRAKVMAWSPDGTAIAVAGEARVIEVFDARTGVRLLELPGHGTDVSALAFGCTGQCEDPAEVADGAAEVFLASTDISGETLLWDLDPDGEGHAIIVEGGVGGVRLLDGDAAALVNTLEGDLLRIDLDDLGVKSLEGYEFWPLPAAVSRDGSVGVIGAVGGTLVFDPESMEKTRSFGEGTRPFAVDGKGSMMVVDGFGTGVPVVLGVDLGEAIFFVGDPDAGVNDSLIDAEFSPDDSLLAVSSTAGSFRLYDVATRTLLGRTGPEWPLTPGQVAFSADGSLLAISVSSGRVAVIAVDPLVAGEEEQAWLLADFVGLDGKALEMRFTPDGSLLALAALDGTINFWRTDDWSRAFTLDIGGETLSFDFTSDSKELVTAAGTSNRLFFFTLDSDGLLEQARERVTRNFTEEECNRFLHLNSCADAAPGTPGIAGTDR